MKTAIIIKIIISCWEVLGRSPSGMYGDLFFTSAECRPSEIGQFSLSLAGPKSNNKKKENSKQLNDAGIQPITRPRRFSVADRVNSMDSSEINPKGSKPLCMEYQYEVRSSMCRGWIGNMRTPYPAGNKWDIIFLGSPRMAGCTTAHTVERDSSPYLCCLKKRVVICLPFSALSTSMLGGQETTMAHLSHWGGGR